VRVRLLLVAVLLAGCSSFGGTPTPGGLTPAPVPETTPTADGSDPAADASATRLVDGHVRQLRNQSYTVSSNYTVRYRNGSLRSRALVRVELAEDRAYRTRLGTAGPEAWRILGSPPATAVFWSDGSLYAGKYGRENGTTYSEFTPGDGGVGTWHFWAKRAAFRGGSSYERGALVSLFGSIETETVGIRSGDGTAAYRLVGTQPRSTEFARRGMRDVHDVRLVVVVVGGIVRSVDLRYEATVDGDPVVVRWRIEYTNVGNTAVRRPEWVARATSDGTAADT
jgi:hypothetical protein